MSNCHNEIDPISLTPTNQIEADDLLEIRGAPNDKKWCYEKESVRSAIGSPRGFRVNPLTQQLWTDSQYFDIVHSLGIGQISDNQSQIIVNDQQLAEADLRLALVWSKTNFLFNAQNQINVYRQRGLPVPQDLLDLAKKENRLKWILIFGYALLLYYSQTYQNNNLDGGYTKKNYTKRRSIKRSLQRSRKSSKRSKQIVNRHKRSTKRNK